MSAGYVELERVWKKFRYGDVHNRLRDAIPALVRRAFGRSDPEEALWRGEFWALRDVSFTVRPGEALGVIGPNGAGKSTILKLLTRILRPTSGLCRLRGRVGALIEVDAGFHPDLTGRENLFLQGAVMGMPRREIARKFDEIVAFAQVERFVETPLKRYSSGMQARLGFAIAAHLEPDVLLVDEVLSVGDLAFQARALDKITQLVRQEIPVVMVTHELSMVSALCTHALLLDRGSVLCAGTPRECISAYLQGEAGVRPAAGGNGDVRIECLELGDHTVNSGEPIALSLDCSVREGGNSAAETVRLRVRLAQTGETVFETGTAQFDLVLPPAGPFTLAFELQMNLPPGLYLIETLAWDRDRGRESFIGPATHVKVGGAPFEGTAQLNPRVRLEGSAERCPP